jgi:nucleoside-diphosphate-sugar epimerase
MRVFVTGASGWIGSATVVELVTAGHDVVGLARSEASATSIQKKGAKALLGGLDDLDSLRRGAEGADAVIHLANKHDWANLAETDRAERVAVQTLAECLVGTNRAFVVSNGFYGLVKGRPATEEDPASWVGPDAPRGGSENLALDYVSRGVRTIITRFAPTVHGAGNLGFIKRLASAAQSHGVSCYVGDGSHAWSAAHRSDVARLIRLGIEKAPAGSRLHGVAEEAVITRSIAEAIGAALHLPVQSIAPEDADRHFGFVGRFFSMEMSASSARTQALLSWYPTGPTLIEDILAGAYN